MWRLYTREPLRNALAKQNVLIFNVYEIIPSISDNIRGNILGNKNEQLRATRGILHADGTGVELRM